MALWRIFDDDSDNDIMITSSSSVHESYSQHLTGSILNSSDDDDDCDGLTWDSESEPAMKRLATRRRGRRNHRPLHVPSYYHMKPLSVKPCEKAEKVRAFAYNNSRQVTTTSSSLSLLPNEFDKKT